MPLKDIAPAGGGMRDTSIATSVEKLPWGSDIPLLEIMFREQQERLGLHKNTLPLIIITGSHNFKN